MFGATLIKSRQRYNQGTDSSLDTGISHVRGRRPALLEGQLSFARNGSFMRQGLALALLNDSIRRKFLAINNKLKCSSTNRYRQQ
jgi:hypothetical protein